MNKYLISFNIPSELEEKLLSIAGYKTPSSGFHLTVCYFYTEKNLEKEISEVFKSINFEPLKLTMRCYDTFHKGAIVIKTKFNEELQKLHEEIVHKLRKIGIEIETDWILDKYNPHVTISYKTIIENYSVVGHSFIFHDLTLKVKKEKVWTQL